MKSFTPLCLVTLFLVTIASTVVNGQEDKYTSKYDNVDLDEILTNERLYKKYFDCLVNKGKCTPDGKELKDNLPEALATGCEKCTEKQRTGTEKVFKFIIEKKPEDWKIIEEIYDPEGLYRAKYREEAEKKGIKLI